MSVPDKNLATSFDLANISPAFFEDPYPTYTALRIHDPVRMMPDGSYFLSRHADLSKVYRDTKHFSSDKRAEFIPKFGDSPLFEHHTTSLVFNDPPFHLRVRKTIIGALTPAAVTSYEAGIAALCDQLLDRIDEKRSADLIAEYAAAIPVEVIGALLDIPREEREPLREWSLAILGALEPVLDAEQKRRGNNAVTAFLAYLSGLVAQRLAKPGDPDHDILTRLLMADEPLTEVELIHNCIFLLNAGHETTTNLIGNGLELFDRFPDQRRRLIENPALAKSSVEEVLRFESSNQLGNRRVVESVGLGNRILEPGALVTLGIGAANRDDRVFNDACSFDIARTPNRHLAFATGIHQCAGLGLARLEGRVALLKFVQRFPDYQLVGQRIRSRRVRFRGFECLRAEIN